MKRVLLVEDDEAANFISKLVLQSAGVDIVDEVLNGQKALDSIAINCPDVILLDINMPVMDGWEFMNEKEANSLCKNIKVVMLTSSMHPSDREKAKRFASIIAYIEKPLTAEKVADLSGILAI